MVLPRGAMGWSALCDCAISRSYLSSVCLLLWTLTKSFINQLFPNFVYSLLLYILFSHLCVGNWMTEPVSWYNVLIKLKYQLCYIYVRGSFKKFQDYSHNLNVSCRIQTKLYMVKDEHPPYNCVKNQKY